MVLSSKIIIKMQVIQIIYVVREFSVNSFENWFIYTSYYVNNLYPTV